MGFTDRDIVALSGGHTLGRCHKVRSGFDGPWTADPLKFDNSYFTNLMDLEWTPRAWDGPLQYQDPSGKFMMLPTDLALKTDPVFAPIAREFADNEVSKARAAGGGNGSRSTAAAPLPQFTPQRQRCSLSPNPQLPL